MPITDYASLKAAASEVAGRDMVSAAIDTLTQELNDKLRLREMLVDFSQSDTTVPADFIAAQTLKVGGTVYSVTTEPAQARGAAGTYSVQNGEFIFNPAETAPEITGRYYGRLAVLSDDADTNAILTNYPSIYLFGILMHHAALVRDEAGVQAWGGSFASHIETANQTAIRQMMDGGTFRVVPRSAP